MGERRYFFCFFILLILLLYAHGVMAAHFRFPCGFTNRSGYEKIINTYKENLCAEGLSPVSEDSFPLALSFSPYIQFDNGCGIGSSFGPFMLIFGDADFIDIPFRLELRYTFAPQGKASSYIRTGASFHITRGDYVKRSNNGFFGAFGVEFFRKKKMGFGLEISYDAAEVEIEKRSFSEYGGTETIGPSKYMMTVYWVFHGSQS